MAAPAAGNSKRLFLHIGIGKTGTTAIQRSLARHRAALEAQGVLLPRTGVVDDVRGAHHPLALRRAKELDIETDRLYAKLCEEIDGSQCRTAILSSEQFCFCLPPLVKVIASRLQQFETTIIFYVRQQSRLIESAYLQALKTNQPYHGTLEDYFEATREAWDFMCRIGPWVEAFGADRICARLYGSAEAKDVRNDFFSLLGVRELNCGTDDERVNRSVIGSFAELIRTIDESSPSPRSRQAMITVICKLSDRFRDHDQTSLMDDTLRERIVDHYRETNRDFAGRFLSSADAERFLESG